MYTLSLDFDKLPIFSNEHVHVYENKLYINSPFIKLKVMASLCSHYFIGYAGLPMVYELRFARFYFRTISLPNLSNGNQSLPELWRHARVHAI